MTLRAFIGCLLWAGMAAVPCPAAVQPQPAQLLVTIFNATGVPAQDARLYIYDVHAKTFQDISYKDEPITLMLTPGRYRLYSSFSVQKGDHIARYASPEANIKLVKGEIETLILSLEEGEDPISQLSYSTLQKTHIAHEMQQYLQ